MLPFEFLGGHIGDADGRDLLTLRHSGGLGLFCGIARSRKKGRCRPFCSLAKSSRK